MIRSITTLVLCCILGLQGAMAETTECTVIRSVPYTITKQGPYCLNSNLIYRTNSGAAIRINVPNVTLDFNGYKLMLLPMRLDTTATGVEADSAQNYLVVRNGVILGFGTGIKLNNGKGQLIEDMVIDRSRRIGIHAYSTDWLTLRGNRVMETGGNNTGTTVYGIYVSSGNGARILGNDVSDTAEDAGDSVSAYGMRVTSNSSFIENNRVSNSASYGIYQSNGINVHAANNRVVNYPNGGTIGMRFNGAVGLYKDNMVIGFTTPYSFGTDGGGNASK